MKQNNVHKLSQYNSMGETNDHNSYDYEYENNDKNNHSINENGCETD